MRVAAKDPCFSSNRIVRGDFGFGCSRHCRDIVRPGRCLVRRVRQIRGAGGRLRSGRRDLPGKVSERNSLAVLKSLLESKECNQNSPGH
jgi:hypothetical protein